MTSRTKGRLIGGFAMVVASLLPTIAYAQDPFGAGGPDSILSGYSSAYNQWTTALGSYGIRLFQLLATIDFAWTCATLAIEKQELQGWITGIIRKLMTIGFFYALLTHGVQWTGYIVQSFMQLGAAGSGGQVSVTTQPSEIMRMGLDIAGRLMSGAAGAAPGTFDFVTNPFGSLAPAFILVIAAFLIVIAFLIVTVHFIMALVESYLVLAAGFIFLGFGGSRWTVPFTEKYVSLIVSVGARLMVLFLVIGLGFNFANIWAAQAQQAAQLGGFGISASGGLQGTEACFSLVAEVGIYGLVCWILPQLAANVIGGTLSFSAGDAIGAGAAGATAALAAAQAVAAVGAAVATGGAAAPVAAADVAAVGAAAGGGAASAMGAAGGAAGAAGSAGAGAAGGAGMADGLGAAAAPAGEAGGAATQPGPPADLGGGASGTGGSDPSSQAAAPGGNDASSSSGSAGGNDAAPAAGEVTSSIQQANAAGSAARAQALRAGASPQQASAAFDQAFGSSLKLGGSGGDSNGDAGVESGGSPDASNSNAGAAADGDAGLEASASEGDRDVEAGAGASSPKSGSTSPASDTSGSTARVGSPAPAVTGGTNANAGAAADGDASLEANAAEGDQDIEAAAGSSSPAGSSPSTVAETGDGVNGAGPSAPAIPSGEDLSAPVGTADVAPSEIAEGSDQSGESLAGDKDSPSADFETGKGLDGTSPDAVPVASGKDLAAPESTSNTAASTTGSGPGQSQPRPPKDLFTKAGSGLQNARNTIQQVHGSLPNDGGTIAGASPKMDHGE